MPLTSLSAVVRQVRKLAAPGDLPAGVVGEHRHPCRRPRPGRQDAGHRRP
jgi:hypothetical protein